MIELLIAILFLAEQSSVFGRENKNLERPYSTIFCHGLNAGPIQAGKYIPEHNSSVSNEKITCKRGIDVLHSPVTAPAMSEIRPNLSDKKLSFGQGIISWYIARKNLNGYGMSIEGGADSPSSSTVNGHGIDFAKTNIGQEADIEKLRVAYNQHIKSNPGSNPIMYGCSRGAAATFSFICIDKPEIKAAVLEGCFDSISSVLEARYPQLLCGMIESGLERFTAYEKNGISPILVVDKWPKEIPVLFITSEKDKEVPPECTERLASELEKRVEGVKVYLLKLKNSSHPHYAYDDLQDKETYENVVHAFYKKHGIPCDEGRAEKGALLLKNSEITSR